MTTNLVLLHADTHKYIGGECFTDEFEAKADAIEVCKMYDGTIMLKQLDIDSAGKEFYSYVNLTPRQAAQLVEALREMSASQ